jgi:hypothetical protein
MLEIAAASTETLPLESVVEIDELGRTFFKRLRGNIDLGSSFAQSNSQKSLTLQGGLTYQSAERIFSFD